MVRSLVAFTSFGIVCWTSFALALTQPNGTPIPQGNGLSGLFTTRGEAIDALADAATAPETFTPSCSLGFEVLQRNSGSKSSFGWYNVTAQQPTLADHHEVLGCNDAVGTAKTVDVKSDPAYLGGAIGFYEAVGNCTADFVFYSEKKWNPDAGQANPFVHLLVYGSSVTPKAFYFAWEDLISGGDDDFDDLTVIVSGISCSGAGAKCQTGQSGICADGTLQCQKGALTCLPLASPATEKCDNLDNDCNGTVDDGACLDACAGVVCPKGQECAAGSCADLCQLVSCDASHVCVAGTCIDKCQCTACATGEQCELDGTCTPAACIGKTCASGEYCASDGTCVDACAGVTCPTGQTCAAGQCGVATDAGAGGSAGAAGSAGSAGSAGQSTGGSATGGGTSGGSGGSSASGGSGGAGTGGSTTKSGDSSDDDGGCGCRTQGGDEGSLLALLAAAGSALVIARRRKRG
jgi:MYXO-CTERM domain-containing protein